MNEFTGKEILSKSENCTMARGVFFLLLDFTTDIKPQNLTNTFYEWFSIINRQF